MATDQRQNMSADSPSTMSFVSTDINRIKHLISLSPSGREGFSHQVFRRATGATVSQTQIIDELDAFRDKLTELTSALSPTHGHEAPDGTSARNHLATRLTALENELALVKSSREQWLEDAEQRLDKVAEERDAAQQLVGSLRSSLNDIRSEHATTTKVAQSDSDRLRNDAKTAFDKVAQAKAQNRKLQSEYQSLAKDLDTATVRTKEIEARLESAHESEQASRNAFDSLKLEYAQHKETTKHDHDDVGARLGQASKEARFARQDLEQMRKDLATATSQAQSTQKRCVDLEKSLAEAVTSHRKEFDSLTTSHTKQLDALEMKHNSNMADSNVSHKQELDNLTSNHSAELDRIRAELKARQADLQTVRNEKSHLHVELKAVKSQSSHDKDTANQRIRDLQMALEKLESDLQQRDDSLTGARRELDTAKSSHEEHRRAAVKDLESAEAAHQQEIEQLSTQHRAETDGHKSDLNQRDDRIAKLSAELDTLRSSEAQTRERLETAHEQELEKMAEKHDRVAKTKLDASHRLLEAEQTKVHELQQRLEDVEANHKTQIKRLESMHDQALLDQQRDAEARATTVNKTVTRELEERHRSDVAKMQAEHQAALSSLSEQHIETLRRKVQDHEASVKALQAEITSLKASQDETTTQIGLLRTEHDNTIELLNADHGHAMHSLEAEHKKLLQNVRDQNAKTIESQASERTISEQQRADEHTAKLANQQLKHDATLKQLQDSHGEVLQQQRNQRTKAQQDFDIQMSDMVRRTNEEHLAKIRDISEKYEAALTKLNNEHGQRLRDQKHEVDKAADERHQESLKAASAGYEETIRDLQDQLTRQQADVEEVRTAKASLEEHITELQAQISSQQQVDPTKAKDDAEAHLAQVQQAHVMELAAVNHAKDQAIATIIRDHTERFDEQKTRFKKSMHSQYCRHSVALEELRSQLSTEKAAVEERLSETLSEHASLSSDSQDLKARIESLQDKCKELECRVAERGRADHPVQPKDRDSEPLPDGRCRDIDGQQDDVFRGRFSDQAESTLIQHSRDSRAESPRDRLSSDLSIQPDEFEQSILGDGDRSVASFAIEDSTSAYGRSTNLTSARSDHDRPPSTSSHSSFAIDGASRPHPQETVLPKVRTDADQRRFTMGIDQDDSPVAEVHQDDDKHPDTTAGQLRGADSARASPLWTSPDLAKQNHEQDLSIAADEFEGIVTARTPQSRIAKPATTQGRPRTASTGGSPVTYHTRQLSEPVNKIESVNGPHRRTSLAKVFKRSAPGSKLVKGHSRRVSEQSGGQK